MAQRLHQYCNWYRHQIILRLGNLLFQSNILHFFPDTAELNFLKLHDIARYACRLHL